MRPHASHLHPILVRSSAGRALGPGGPGSPAWEGSPLAMQQSWSSPGLEGPSSSSCRQGHTLLTMLIRQQYRPEPHSTTAYLSKEGEALLGLGLFTFLPDDSTAARRPWVNQFSVPNIIEIYSSDLTSWWNGQGQG